MEKLLKMGAEPNGRKEIAAKTGIDEKVILKWVSFADLFRVKGISTQYSELLEAAGVDTVDKGKLFERAGHKVIMFDINSKKYKI